MEFNPHQAKYLELSEQIQVQQRRIKEIDAELQWHAEIDGRALTAQHQAEVSAWQAQVDSIHAIQQSVQEKTQAKQALEASLKSMWNPKNWFDAAEEAKRVEIRGFTKVIKQLNATRAQHEALCKECASKSQKTLSLLNKYRAIQPDALHQQRLDAAEAEKQLAQRFKRVSQLKALADDELAVPLQNLRDKRALLEIEKRTLNQALMLEQQLNAASGGYQRKQIHEESGRVLGDGRPGIVVKKARSAISRLTSDIDKLEKRLHQLKNKHARDIRTLVVDGNNLCYQESRFVGLGPLRALLDELPQEYTVKIIFDASIRKLLKANDQAIRAALNPSQKASLVHVVATRQSADETILFTANDDPFSYVVSNDRFGEFEEMPCVRDKRLIRHEILDNKVLLRDLGVAGSFG